MSVNEKMTAIADAIRAKTGGADPLTLDQMAQEIEGLSSGDYDEGFEEGVLSVPFYRASVLQRTFELVVFPENYECVIHLQKIQEQYAVFRNAKNLKSVKMISDNTEGTISLNAFVSETEVEFVDLTEYCRKISVATRFAYKATKLKSVYGALDMSNCTVFTDWLYLASNLEDMEFVPNTIKHSLSFSSCPLLTDTTIQSIIDGLADLTGTTAQKVTFHKAVGNKLTDEQKTTVSAKNWTLVY